MEMGLILSPPGSFESRQAHVALCKLPILTEFSSVTWLNFPSKFNRLVNKAEITNHLIPHNYNLCF